MKRRTTRKHVTWPVEPQTAHFPPGKTPYLSWEGGEGAEPDHAPCMVMRIGKRADGLEEKIITEALLDDLSHVGIVERRPETMNPVHSQTIEIAGSFLRRARIARRARGEDIFILAISTKDGSTMLHVTTIQELTTDLASDDPERLGHLLLESGERVFFRDVFRAAYGTRYNEAEKRGEDSGQASPIAPEALAPEPGSRRGARDRKSGMPGRGRPYQDRPRQRPGQGAIISTHHFKGGNDWLGIRIVVGSDGELFLLPVMH